MKILKTVLAMSALLVVSNSRAEARSDDTFDYLALKCVVASNASCAGRILKTLNKMDCAPVARTVRCGEAYRGVQTCTVATLNCIMSSTGFSAYLPRSCAFGKRKVDLAAYDIGLATANLSEYSSSFLTEICR